MRSTPDLRALLAQGKHGLSLGRIPEVVALLATRPALAPRLIEYLWDEDEGVSQRAADVLERISRKPSPPIQHAMADAKQALLGLLPEASPKKLRWNLALMVGRLWLTVAEAHRSAAVLQSWLGDSSSIVKTAALQGVADLTRHDPALLPAVLDLLRLHGRSGTPAMRARSRLLLARLENTQGKQSLGGRAAP
jgi:HEAT repeat protein